MSNKDLVRELKSTIKELSEEKELKSKVEKVNGK
jgi:hypothetical protein